MPEPQRAQPLPVLLSPVTWDFPLVGYTRRMSEALTRAGHECLFVQIPSERTALQRLRLAGRTPAGEEHVVRPWLAAPKHLWRHVPAERLEGWMRRAARRLKRELDGRLDWERAAALVLTPAWEPWLDELPFGRVVYDCIDDFRVHVPLSGLEERFRRWEERLVDRADGAVATARILLDAILARRPELPTRLVPNGVDDAWFQARARELQVPPELAGVPRPRVGFVGSLADWIDWPLVDAVVRALPDHHFVFVGPVSDRAGTAPLRERENVHLLGPRAHDEVPAYVAAFDVCWAPKRTIGVGRAQNPVKVYEYLALGKPVVATSVAGLDDFEGLVARADDAAGLAALIAHATQDATQDAPRDADVRRAFAAQNSWSVRAASLIDFLRELAQRSPRPLA